MSEIYRNKDVNDMYDYFTKIYEEICEKIVQLRRKSNRLKPQLLSDTIKEISKRKNKLWLRLRYTKFTNKKPKDEYNFVKRE